MKIERFWKSNWVSDNKEQKAKAKWAMILRNKLKEKHGTGNIKLCIYSQKKATVPYICFPLPLQHTWSWSRFLPGRFPPYFIEAWEITERTWGAPGEHWTRNYFCRLYKKIPQWQLPNFSRCSVTVSCWGRAGTGGRHWNQSLPAWPTPGSAFTAWMSQSKEQEMFPMLPKHRDD